MPCGNTSVNDTLLIGTPDVFTTSMVSVDGWLPVTKSGLNCLFNARLAVCWFSVLVTAWLLVGPSALVTLPAASVLVHGPAPAANTSNERSQLPPAGKVAPSSRTPVAPGLAVMLGEPPQEVAALAGLATIRPPARPSSLIDTFVSAPLDWLFTVTVARTTPPRAVLAGWNCLFAVRPAETVKLALRLAGMVPALDVKLAGVMVLV